MNTELLTQIQLIKHLEGSKGEPFNKINLKQARDKLNEMALPLMEDKMNLIVGKYVLEKWYDKPRDRDRVMIFTKESFDRREEFNHQKTLGWTKS